MFGRTLGYDEILSLVNSLRTEHYPLAAQNLIAAIKPVVKGMTADTDEEKRSFERERLTFSKKACGFFTASKRALWMSSPIRPAWSSRR